MVLIYETQAFPSICLAAGRIPRLVKVVLKEAGDAELCHRHFLPDVANHRVAEWDGRSRLVARRYDA